MNISTQVFPLWAHKADDGELSVHSTKQGEGDVSVTYKMAVVEGFEAGDEWLAIVNHIKACNDENDAVISAAFIRLVGNVQMKVFTSIKDLVDEIMSSRGEEAGEEKADGQDAT